MSHNVNASVRFHFNFAAKTICGSKASFAKASSGVGPIYEELAKKMASHPDFTIEVIAPKAPAKPKQTYAGMDIAFMRDFLTANGDSLTLKRLDDVIAFAEANGKSKYPLAKRFFLDANDCFDYVEAKRIVSDYRYQQTCAQADAMAAKIAAVAA